MLKIVYPICCGMDVHKSFLVAYIRIMRYCQYFIQRLLPWSQQHEPQDPV